LLPKLTGRFDLAVSARLRAFRLEVNGTFWIPSKRTVEHSNAAGQFVYGGAGIVACGVPSVRRLDFTLCAGPEFGAITAKGLEVDQPAKQRVFYAAAQASVGMWFHVGQFVALGVNATLGVPFRRPRFTLEPYGELHRVQPVTISSTAGFELNFP
jgi:hypothetical protein